MIEFLFFSSFFFFLSSLPLTLCSFVPFFFLRGYLFSFSLYERNGEKEMVEITVDRMLDSLDSREEHHVIVDSYFGGLPTLKKIVEHGFHGLMSCRKDRPSFLFANYLHDGLDIEGEWKTARGRIEGREGREQPFLAIAFQSARSVNFLSTMHGSEEKIEVEEEIQEVNQEEERCTTRKVVWTVPKVRHDYLLNMNFVDKLDREVLLYLFNHKKSRWEYSVFSCIANTSWDRRF